MTIEQRILESIAEAERQVAEMKWPDFRITRMMTLANIEMVEKDPEKHGEAFCAMYGNK